MAAYYIDFDAGDDMEAGTKAAPWKHCPGDANYTGGGSLSSGDAIYFKLDVTYEGMILTESDGVTYTVDPTWGTGIAILDGSGYDRGIYINHNDITINGIDALKFTGPTISRAAVMAYIDGTLAGITITRSIFDLIGSDASEEGIGVKISSDQGIVQNSVISYCTFTNCYAYAIKISGCSNHIDIHHNRISGCGDRGDAQVNISGNDGAIEDPITFITFHHNELFDGGGTSCSGINLRHVGNNEIYNNYFHGHTAATIFVNCLANTKTAGTVKIYNNKLTECKNRGIWIGTSNATQYPIIFNNVIIADTDIINADAIHLGTDTAFVRAYNNSIYFSYGIYLASNTCTNCIFKNNILNTNYASYESANGCAATWDYNICHRRDLGVPMKYDGTNYATLVAFRDGTTEGDHDVWADPMYVNAAAENLLIPAESPAKDTGADLTVEGGFATDYASNNRPVGEWDIGAFEFTIGPWVMIYG